MSSKRPARGLSKGSLAIGVAGLIGLAAVWLTQVHATVDGRVLDCGSVVSKVTTLNTIRGSCHHALGRRFAVAFVVIIPGVVASWAVQLRFMGYLGGRKIEPRGAPRLDVRVGARIGRGNASYPLARLSATPEQIVVVSPVGSAVLDRERVESVSQARRGVHTTIEFRTVEDSGKGVRVYARDPQKLLAGLSALGWPVS